MLRQSSQWRLLVSLDSSFFLENEFLYIYFFIQNKLLLYSYSLIQHDLLLNCLMDRGTMALSSGKFTHACNLLDFKVT